MYTAVVETLILFWLIAIFIRLGGVIDGLKVLIKYAKADHDSKNPN